MKRTLALIAAVAVLLSGCASAPTAVAPDARKPPALRLGDGATPLSYDATLAIDPVSTAFTGEIRIRFRVNRATPVLWMNATQLAIESARFQQGDRAIEVSVIGDNGTDFVGFEPKSGAFPEGETTATIRYKGAFEPVSTRGLFRQAEAGEWYVISQFEAYSARRAFPCFDEPGWKTPWKVTIDAPAANVVVSNTPESRRATRPAAPDGSATSSRRLRRCRPTSSRWPWVRSTSSTAASRARSRTPLRYLAPKGRGAETRFAKSSTPKLLELLEDYFGSPHPFAKLDSVSIVQTVGFGAMENVGMITYASSLLLARPSEESVAFQRSYGYIAAHEIAHMWYGNLVTPAWWDDIWLNEAFATWMGRKIANQYRPNWDSGWRRNFGRSRSLLADRLPSARRIRNPVVAKDDINAAFDRITYDKGGEVLSMFEAWLGPDGFRQGVRNYIKAREYGTATSQDFFRALGDAAGKGDAALAAFNAFVDQPGIPLMDASLDCAAGRTPRLRVTQSRLQPAGTSLPALKWTTPACFAYSAGGKLGRRCVEVVDGANAIELEGAAACPAWVVGNAGGGGHYVVRPDDVLAQAVVLHLPAMPEHEAAAVVSDASLLSRSGLMSIDRALGLFHGGLNHPAPAVRRVAIEGLRLMHPEHAARSAFHKNAIDAAAIVSLAHARGWGDKPGESDENQELRVLLMPYAALTDPALRGQARSLALLWLKDRSSVDAMMVVPVLDTAARFADEATYAALEAATLASRSVPERRKLFSALAKVRDPGLRARAFALAVDTRVSGRDALQFIEDALQDDANRVAAFAFVRANFDALKAKVPPETAANFARDLERLCMPADRQAFVDFWKDRAGQFVGGPRKYALALEAIDICVAAGLIQPTALR